MARRIDLETRRQLLGDRQLLGEPGRAGRDVADVVASLALLHSTDPVTPYLSLHARSDVTVADVDAALYDGHLDRFTTIRRTVFAMDRDAAVAAHGAANGALASSLRRQLLTWLDAAADVDESADRFLARTERAVLAHLGDTGPSSGHELSAAVPELRVRVESRPGASYSKPFRITSKVLEILAAEVSIVRSRPTGVDYTSGAWRWRRAGTSDDGIVGTDPATALARLAERYLRSFAPATVTDLTWWTGLTKTKVRAALAAVDAVEIDVGGDEPAFALGDDPLEPTGTGGLALLPGLDSTAMGWKQREWYVNDAPAAGIFDRNGNAGPTIWFEGHVVGVWTQRVDGSIAVETFESLDSRASDQLADEAGRLERWFGDVRVRWRYPTPLTKQLEA